MRPRIRGRGIGCLGCLPVSGLLIGLLPLILVGALIYWLVSRQNTVHRNTGQGNLPTTTPPPVVSGSLFCTRCGTPIESDSRFCRNCGSQAG